MKESDGTENVNKEDAKRIVRMCPNPGCKAEFDNPHTTICTSCGWVTVPYSFRHKAVRK